MVVVRHHDNKRLFQQGPLGSSFGGFLWGARDACNELLQSSCFVIGGSRVALSWSLRRMAGMKKMIGKNMVKKTNVDGSLYFAEYSTIALLGFYVSKGIGREASCLPISSSSFSFAVYSWHESQSPLVNKI